MPKEIKFKLQYEEIPFVKSNHKHTTFEKIKMWFYYTKLRMFNK